MSDSTAAGPLPPGQQRWLRRSERVVSAYLAGLAGFAILTAISPLFFFSWPYLALAAVPTIRWFRRRRQPLSRVMIGWIVGLAGLMIWLPLGTAVVYVAEGHIDASETWALAIIGICSAPFLVAAWKCHERASRRDSPCSA